jgi:NADH-quinone oxidoreductase subunit K
MTRMELQAIVFYVFAFITLGSAFVVVFSRNIIYSAFSLLFTFFGVAGLYVLLNADFLAVTQILIYVGGILVLLLFGVMLTNRVNQYRPDRPGAAAGGGRRRFPERTVLFYVQRGCCRAHGPEDDNAGARRVADDYIPAAVRNRLGGSAGGVDRCSPHVPSRSYQVTSMDAFFQDFFTWLPNIQLAHFLIVSAILFSLGIFGILTRRNAIMVLMGIELVLNAANINLVAFSRYGGMRLDGQAAAVFVIILAAAEAAIALAIILNIYHRFQTVNVDEISHLKE